MATSGVVLLATHAVISAVGGSRSVPLMEWGSVALIGFPLIWLGVVLRLGPLSPKRRARAGFWKLARFFLWVMAASTLFKLTLIFVALIYGSCSIATALGQSVPSFIWDQFWRGDHLPTLTWHFGAWAAAVLVMLYAAHRLGPVVRRLEGKCARCGYLLRGLTEARCPECGTPFNASDPEQGAVPPDGPVDRSAS